MTSAFEFDLTDLEIGTVLPFDLFGPDGAIVHKSGVPVSQRLLDRLKILGVNSVSIRGEDQLSSVEDVLNSFYDPILIQAITKRIDDGVEELGKSMHCILKGHSVETNSLAGVVCEFSSQVKNDISAVLAVLSQRKGEGDLDLIRVISERSTLISLLSISVATSMGLSQDKVLKVGTAALLSDVSLAAHPDWFDQAFKIKPEVYENKDYLDHPTISSQLLRNTNLFDKEVIDCVAQTHEMANGSGFPKGLSSSSSLLESRIISVSEKYAILTSSLFSEKTYMESDVLALLLHRAVKGEIDRDILLGVIKSLSMYPIGSLVQLEDGSCAVVVQPNLDSPFKPMVKSCHGAGKVMDLSVSNQAIVGPSSEMRSSRSRIEKSNLDAILWRPQQTMGICPGINSVMSQ